MPDEIEALIALQRDPEINRAALAIMIDESMCDPAYAALMKVLTVVWREEDASC